LRVEAGIDAVKLAQSANEKSGANEDNHRQRDLRDDQRAALLDPTRDAGVFLPRYGMPSTQIDSAM
jgi:hypothetical protein